MIRTPVEGFRRPPHSVSLPKGREDARITAEAVFSVPSPLGEKDRMRGDFGNDTYSDIQPAALTRLKLIT
jgi:hypothetical protein